ncbi:hypothetical protein AHAS_Ahas11G0044800 [Arachis hypogaea]
MYSYGMLILKIIGKKYYDTKKSHSSELYYLGGILRKRSSYLISNLDWNYSHRRYNTKILHLDIKPQNIPLDENFCPKITDFGLAKIYKKNENIVSMLGTRGIPEYIAPEMISRIYSGVSHKSNMHSYGILILEMIGEKKNYDTEKSHGSELYFFDWIYTNFEESNIHTRSLVSGEEEK